MPSSPRVLSLAGARQFARQEGLPSWDIFRIEYHDPDDRVWLGRKAQQAHWMCLLLNAPTHHLAS